MRNANDGTKITKIIAMASKLPFFTLDDLSTVEENKHYLRVLLSRYEKAGKILRLKKGVYVVEDYINNVKINSSYSSYTEFVANILYQPSYLSLDYILYKNSILTEIPNNFTLVTKNKTAKFSNNIGNFFYHKVKDELFIGFEIEKVNNYSIYKASKAKALFDFIYLRKNYLNDKKAVTELRLNLDNFTKNDFGELKKYVLLEGSKKLWKILNYL